MSEEVPMVSVPIPYLLTRRSLPVDVFVRFSSEKYVLIGRQSRDIEFDRFKKYLKREITHLYVRQCDYEIYSRQTIALSEKLCENKKASVKLKIHSLSCSFSSIFSKFEAIGVHPSFIEESKSLSRHAIKLAEKLPLDMIMLLLDALPPDSKKHSLGVYYLSLMLAHKAGWTYERSLENIALTALLHDVGEIGLDTASLEKAPETMNPAERKIYESHIDRALGVLSVLPNIPSDVLTAVYQHHERSDGSGFPQRLSEQRISPIAKIVSVSDEFASYALSSPRADSYLRPLEAIRQMCTEKKGHFNRELLAVLAMMIFEGKPGNRISKLLSRAA